MICRVRLFAGAREAAGAGEVEQRLAEGATVADLRRALVEATPPLAAMVACSRFAVNGAYATDDTPLPPDAELALSPPVSGG